MVILFTPHARTLSICCLTVDADAGAPARRSQLLLTAEDQTQEVRHETLRPLQRLPVSQAHGHDLLHRAEACRLNPVDASIALWGAPRGAAQQVGGRLDVSDEIVAAGEDVPGWAMGDPVLTHGNSFRPQGGLAQFTVQDPAHSSPHTSLSKCRHSPPSWRPHASAAVSPQPERKTLTCRDPDVVWSRYRSFERVLEQPLAAAFAVLPEARLFLTEGNYLLMHDLAWTRVPAVMTEVWYVHLPADVRRRRLVDGHIMFGKRSEAALE